MRCPLTIAGSDPSGGAGLQADVRVFAHMGLHPLSVVTCVTAQNPASFRIAQSIEPAAVAEQLDAILGSFDVGGAKTGLIPSAVLVGVIAEKLAVTEIPLIVDPVLSVTVGGWSAGDDLVSAYLEKLVPLAHILTPNSHEAKLLTGIEVKDLDGAKNACIRLHELGARHVLLKGGHWGGDPVIDLFYDGKVFETFEHPRLRGEHHGTGCHLSAYIAGSLSSDSPVIEAVRNASRFVAQAMAEGFGAGEGLSFLQLPALRDDITKEVVEALARVGAELPGWMLPEVGSNLGYAREGASSAGDIAALTGRIHRVGDRPACIGAVSFGASRHVARIILAAMSHDACMRSAMNVRYSPDIVDSARALGLSVASFDRAGEPEGRSTMEWGTEQAIRDHGGVPDVIYDTGGMRKEAMIRVIGRNPKEVADKVLAIARKTGVR